MASENKPSVEKQSLQVSGGWESSSRTGYGRTDFIAIIWAPKPAELATNAKTPYIQSPMNPELLNRVCVVSLLTGPKYQNIIANVEATELGFLLETFNPASSLPFRRRKRREPRYLMLVPQKTDFQLLDLTPSIPTCLFWIPTGHSQQYKKRAPPVLMELCLFAVSLV